MTNLIEESKKLVLKIKENEARYVSGELDLIPDLEKTEQLYKDAISSAAKDENTASRVLQDSSLMLLQTKIARQCAKSYKFDSLVFSPVSFAEKTRNHYCPSVHARSKSEAIHEVWEKLGEYSRQKMFTVPTFNFIYGTFDAEPVEPVKRKRKQVIKDKIGDITKADKVNPQTASDEDVMNQDAVRVFSIFLRLVAKSESHNICFYEFVTDPNSFTRTVENIFLVSLLVKYGHICFFEDDEGLPSLRSVGDTEKQNWSNENMQTVISITVEDWQNIVKTFKFTRPLIPVKRKAPVEDKS